MAASLFSQTIQTRDKEDHENKYLKQISLDFVYRFIFGRQDLARFGMFHFCHNLKTGSVDEIKISDGNDMWHLQEMMTISRIFLIKIYFMPVDSSYNLPVFYSLNNIWQVLFYIFMVAG